ncbi:putative glycosyltransferase [Winogradskyella wandonensis]|uniref:Putative glycosyltransferase n=1 Tax=Winogradskyella wandonensis TaxID=1442586 RepID=A0A4R1KK75_9FLAO|nr:glycosyltransferase [Winogradskyella wandonensis]TCK65142.1 putative glycosyltransferase [Winogradskyella wandonensis]
MKRVHDHKRILIAPLYWGLGHATRCIPIINALITHGFEPVIASDGGALELLRKEFPKLKSFELPSYNISYPKKGNSFKWKVLTSSPHILKTIKRENAIIKTLVETEHIDGIISDNRFGVRHPSVPSIYITHQLKVLSGKTTWLSSKWHQDIIKKFDECWVPDFGGDANLSGILGHIKKPTFSIKYIGALSRFKKEKRPETIDILAVLSGPEPQRTQFEEKLINLFKKGNKQITLVRGIVEDQQKITKIGEIVLYNFMTTDELQNTINSSKLLVSRSGYTTIMDLAKLQKKVVFIPTPGQYEQLYLAKMLSDKKIAPAFSQDSFSLSDLKWEANYSGFSNIEQHTDFKRLFSLF